MIDTRLIVDSATAPPRVAHEKNVIGTMNILAACGGPDSPVTKVVFKSSAHYYGCERDDPSFFTEDMQRPHEPRTRLESDIVEADDAVQGFAARNPHVTVTTLRFCNGLGPDLRHEPQRAAGPARGAGHPRLRPALPVHPRGRHRRRAAPRGHQRAAGHPQRRAGRRPRAVGDRGAARQAVRADPAAVGRPASATGRAEARGSSDPGRGQRQLRYGRGLDNRKLKQSGLPLQPHDARDGAGVCRGAAAETAARERRGAISLRARSGGIPPLVTKCQRDESAADHASAVAGVPYPPLAPFTICAPHAYSSDRPRRIPAAPRRRRRGRGATSTTSPRRT